MTTVFVVDDEKTIRELVGFNFSRLGFKVEVAGDGQTAYDFLRTKAKQIDLVILDLMLPGMDGIDVCRRLRQDQVDVPIIVLTGKNNEIDLILSLELGADDYITKPFSPRELVARGQAVIRRKQNCFTVLCKDTPDEILKAGDLSLNITRHEVRVAATLIEVTRKEFDLLQYFMENPGVALPRSRLVNRVLGYADTLETRIIDVHISNLREKIEREPRNPRFIRTVRGIGYQFCNE